MPQKAALYLGYPARAKALMCLPLLACVYAVWRTVSGLSLGWWTGPVLIGAFACCVPALYGFRTNCAIDASGIMRKSLWGKRSFRREEFLGHERIATEPGAPPDLLLRFKSGVVFLGASLVNRPAQEVIDFLHDQWGVSAADYEPPTLGAVDPVQSFEYENLHVSGLAVFGVLCTLAAIWFPVFALLGIVAGYCIRAVWRALGRLDTSEGGITFTHRFLPSIKMAWHEIESATYWDSFAQGGLKIRGKSGQTIRLYRWINRYPMLDRLLHDRLTTKSFWPTLQLPLRVDLNRRRRMGVLVPYFLLMVNALALLWEGNLLTFTLVLSLPTAVAALMIWGSSRVVEFDQDGARDIWRYMWFRKINFYPRGELLEARLGRQLTVGGLWLRFGDTRLEITNGDASLPPEQILTCLRENWAWDRKKVRDGQYEDQRLRGAA